MSAPQTDSTATRQPPRELAKILGDCRDIAVHRLLQAFATKLDRVGDALMERAGRTDVREEQQLFLDARDTVRHERARLLDAFDRHLRVRIDNRIVGREAAKADFFRLDASKLALVDPQSMDESVITGNLARVIENNCQEELLELNRGIGHLLGRPELASDANPFGPVTVVDAFVDALKSIDGEMRVKFAVLKELNQASMGEVAAIYADINKHLQNLRVVPARSRAPVARRPPAPKRPAPSSEATEEKETASEIDVMALYRRMYGGKAQSVPMQAGMMAGGAPELSPVEAALAARYLPVGPLAPTPAGYVPSAPIMTTVALGEGLARLQAGESAFELGDGTPVQFSGIPDGRHNVLRDLARTPENLPVMLDYKALAASGSLHNTPPAFSIYIVGLVFQWAKKLGGLTEVQRINRKKADLINTAIDESGGFYRGHAVPEARSVMNIPFHLPSEELEDTFAKEAKKNDLIGLKGHRSVGGMRASIYNARTVAGAEALVQFMKEFQKKNG